MCQAFSVVYLLKFIQHKIVSNYRKFIKHAAFLQAQRCMKPALGALAQVGHLGRPDSFSFFPGCSLLTTFHFLFSSFATHGFPHTHCGEEGEEEKKWPGIKMLFRAIVMIAFYPVSFLLFPSDIFISSVALFRLCHLGNTIRAKKKKTFLKEINFASV